MAKYRVHQKLNILPDGIHRGKITNYVLPTEGKDFFTFTFSVEQEDGSIVKIPHFVNVRWRNAVFVNYANSVNIKPDDEGSIDFDEFLDRHVLITTEHEKAESDFIKYKILNIVEDTSEDFAEGNVAI